MARQIIPLLEELLAQSTGRAVKVRQLQTLGGGCINSASRAVTSEGNFFVKWNAQCAADMFEREAESLRELQKPATGLVVPEVLGSTTGSGQTPGILVTAYLEPFTSSRSQQEEVLGRGLAALHRYTAKQFGFYHNNYCGSTPQDNRWHNDWTAFFGQQRIWHLARMIEQDGNWGNGELKAIEALLEKLPEIAGHRPVPSLTHGDLWSGNFMNSEKGPALIDPAASYADRETDLAMMRMFGGFSDRVWQAYHEAWPLPPEWRDRSSVYMLYHYLNHYYLFGGGYGAQAMAIVQGYLG